VARLDLENVVFAGRVNQAELIAHYQAADVLLCMSEHEGFGVPLVESMHFGVPVVAYKAAAVPETLGGAGMLVNRKDHEAIAELVGMLIHNADLRDRVVLQQRRRLTAFEARSVKLQLYRYVQDAQSGATA
jgi:glycosyltransferase involved in cell wall biosynthesis